MCEEMFSAFAVCFRFAKNLKNSSTQARTTIDTNLLQLVHLSLAPDNIIKAVKKNKTTIYFEYVIFFFLNF